MKKHFKNIGIAFGALTLGVSLTLNTVSVLKLNTIEENSTVSAVNKDLMIEVDYRDNLLKKAVGGTPLSFKERDDLLEILNNGKDYTVKPDSRFNYKGEYVFQNAEKGQYNYKSRDDGSSYFLTEDEVKKNHIEKGQVIEVTTNEYQEPIKIKGL